MSPFIAYLLIINLVAFLAFTIDFFLCRRSPDLDDSFANSVVMDLFPIAGGAVGALIALFIWNGMLHRHRINKHNVAWWFLAIFCLVVWCIIASFVTGLVSFDLGSLLGFWNVGLLKVLGTYFLVINVATLVLFVVDKRNAENGNNYGKRAPEAKLLGLCLIGGSVGGLIGMYAAHHKTRKWYFVWGLPVFLILDIALIFYLHGIGLI